MLTIGFALLLVLHGLVHLLYMGQSAHFYALEPGLLWPDGSWALGRLLGDPATRTLATVTMVVAAIGFVAGGAGLLAGQAWWRGVTVAAALFSTVVYLLLWDGRSSPRIPPHPAARTNSETFLHIFCTIGHYPGW